MEYDGYQKQKNLEQCKSETLSLTFSKFSTKRTQTTLVQFSSNQSIKHLALALAIRNDKKSNSPLKMQPLKNEKGTSFS
jgi:hypothetical protein